MKALRCISLAFGLVVCAGGDAATADDALPTLAALSASVKDATGAQPVNERLVVKVHRSSLDGSTTTYRSEAGNRQTSILGPYTTSSGRIDAKSWHSNPNGQTVLEQRDPGLAARDPYEVTVSRVAQPIDAYVIARLNKRGTGTRQYIDPATFHVVRLENVRAAQTVATTYDDFRTTGGYTRSWHWTTSRSHRRVDWSRFPKIEDRSNFP